MIELQLVVEVCDVIVGDMDISEAEHLWRAARARMRVAARALVGQNAAAEGVLGDTEPWVDELLDQVIRPEFFGALKHPLWSVMRQDDNGNRFEIVSDLSREDAQAKLDDLEASAHKQYYWLAPKVPAG